MFAVHWPAAEVRRELPKLRRALCIYFILSVASVVVQLAYQRASVPPAGGRLAGKEKIQSGFALNNDARATVAGQAAAHGMNGASVSIAGVLMAVSSLSMQREMHMSKGLFTFAFLNFLNFAANTRLLVLKIEAPPGVRHLLSFHCQVPVADIAHFVRQQQRYFHSRLVGRIPGGAALLPPLEEGSWPELRGPTVDLCSPSWALGNMYLLASCVVVLWMHIQVLRMLRSSAEDGISDDGSFAEGGVLGQTHRVFVLDHGAAASGLGEVEQRSFVPFSGLPHKLDL